MLRKTSLFLRVGLISLLLFLALETLKHTSDFPEPLFVLFDSSESMKIEENGLKADEQGHYRTGQRMSFFNNFRTGKFMPTIFFILKNILPGPVLPYRNP